MRLVRLRLGCLAVLLAQTRPISWPSPARMRRLLAVSLVTALVAACGSTTVSPPPSASPPATILPASATPAASPSPTPGPTLSPTSSPSSPTPAIVNEGMPVLIAPSGAMRIAPIPDSPGVQAGGTPTGPYAYLQGIGNRTLYVADAGGGSERAVLLPLSADEQIDEVQTDGLWIVVAVSGPATPGASENGLTCGQQERLPRAWRILAAPLGADGLPEGSFRKIDAGVASRAFEVPGNAGLACPYPATPPVGLGTVLPHTPASSIFAPLAASGTRIRGRSTGLTSTRFSVEINQSPTLGAAKQAIEAMLDEIGDQNGA